MTREEELHYALLKAEEKIKVLQRRMEWKDAAYKAQGKATYDINVKYARLQRKHHRLARIVLNICTKGRNAQAMMSILNLVEERDDYKARYDETHSKLRDKVSQYFRLEKEHAKCKS